jgi:hypothetical protein
MVVILPMNSSNLLKYSTYSSSDSISSVHNLAQRPTYDEIKVFLKAEKFRLSLSFSDPIKSGRLSLFVENVMSTLYISGNKKKVSISSKVPYHAAKTIACEFSSGRYFLTSTAFSIASYPT